MTVKHVHVINADGAESCNATHKVARRDPMGFDHEFGEDVPTEVVEVGR
jgi:hypothetical protein